MNVETTTQIPATKTRSFVARVGLRATAALAVACAALTLMSAPASAAATPNPSIAATCQNGQVSVQAPDLRLIYKGWQAWYRVQLYTYTSTGWRLANTPTWMWTDSNAWVAPDDVAYNVARGTYVHAMVDEYYYVNGTFIGSRLVVPRHGSLVLPQYVAGDSSYCRV